MFSVLSCSWVYLLGPMNALDLDGLCNGPNRASFPSHAKKTRRTRLRISEDSLHKNFGGLDSLGGAAEHLALLLLVLQIQNTGPRGNRDGYDRLGGFGGYGTGPGWAKL